MRQREDELNELGVKVVIVTFENDAMAQAYREQTQLEWPILIDAARDVYSAYGMERGGWWDILGPSAWWAYAKLLWNGRKLEKSGSDIRQLGGDVLVDPQGIVRLHYVGRGPADRPPVEDLLAVVRP